MTFLWSVLGFVLAMGLLVAIHEAGHYFVAKFFNVKVLQFSLGFGKPFFTRQVGETQFQLSPIPLGGFVKFADERNEEVIAPKDLHRAFNRQTVYKRFLIVLAGPVINLLFAWLAFSLVYFSGVAGYKPVISESLNGLEVAQQIVQVNAVDVDTWQDVQQQILLSLVRDSETLSLSLSAFNQTDGAVHTIQRSLSELDIDQPKQNWLGLLGLSPYSPELPAIVGQVVKHSPSSRAGLKKGDLILSIDGVTLENWKALVSVVRVNPNKLLSLRYQRNNQIIESQIQLISRQVKNEIVGSIGLAVQIPHDLLLDYQVTQSYSVLDAVAKGWGHSVELVEMTLVMIKRLLQADVSVDNLSGPVSIAQYSGQAVQSGWVAFLSLLGLLSLSLGVMNLLPIPVLDGGHLFFYLIEMIKGSPVPQSVEVVGQKIGLFIILSFTFFIIINDVVRIANG